MLCWHRGKDGLNNVSEWITYCVVLVINELLVLTGGKKQLTTHVMSVKSVSNPEANISQ